MFLFKMLCSLAKFQLTSYMKSVGRIRSNVPLRSFARRTLTTIEVRKSFVKYFEDYDHIHVPSSSVIPDDDDRSLMFTNAGMNQFKSIFLGSRENRFSYLERAVNYQKCIRAGGKHNDLDDVGQDLHHQTFFEMLGNWSFNNGYSKEAACHLAWNFLVDVMKIDPARLYVTYFSGNKEVPVDEQCRLIWIKIGVPESHILPFDKDNFWEMGSSGPCGPCTEIHYDRIPGRKNASHLVNVDDSVVELWNLVFMSLSRGANGRLDPLPSMHVDTGMGLERLVSVVQNVPSNFDTDVFTPLMSRISELTPHKYGGLVGTADKLRRDAAYRILADHLRAVTVALIDGATPAGTGAGFIVRKMLRRACWQAVHRLEMDRGACAELIPVVTETFRSAYPGFTNAAESVQLVFRKEEEQYWKILDKGKQRLERIVSVLPKNVSTVSGEDAWTLHDTHGLPIDIVEDLLREEGKTVDTTRFEQLRTQAKEISTRASCFTSTSDAVIDKSDFPTQSDHKKYEYSLGGSDYVFPRVSSKILAVFDGSERVQSLSGSGALVLEQCQFYAEEGGQKPDTGLLSVDGTPVFSVENVQKVNEVVVLYGHTIEGAEIFPDSVVVQQIDEARRCGMMRAHSATHLLNWALRRVGASRGQRGSAVDVDSLRFDYAVDENAGEDDVVPDIESLIRNVIKKSYPVKILEMPLDEARSVRQLQSEFRELKQYPSTVRVALVGDQLNEDAIAVECCSGSHIQNTRSIVDVVIVSDRSSSKGVRRMTALVGEPASQARQYAARLLEDLADFSSGSRAIDQLSGFKKDIDWSRVPYVESKKINLLLTTLKRSAKPKKIKAI